MPSPNPTWTLPGPGSVAGSAAVCQGIVQHWGVLERLGWQGLQGESERVGADGGPELCPWNRWLHSSPKGHLSHAVPQRSPSSRACTHVPYPTAAPVSALPGLWGMLLKAL